MREATARCSAMDAGTEGFMKATTSHDARMTLVGPTVKLHTDAALVGIFASVWLICNMQMSIAETSGTTSRTSGAVVRGAGADGSAMSSGTGEASGIGAVNAPSTAERIATICSKVLPAEYAARNGFFQSWQI